MKVPPLGEKTEPEVVDFGGPSGWLSGVLCNSHKTENYSKLPQNYPKLLPNYPKTTPKLPRACLGSNIEDFRLRPFFDHSFTLCYATVLPGRKSGFWAGFRPDSRRESIKIGPLAGRRLAGGPILMFSRLDSGRDPARKLDDPPDALLRNIGFGLTPLQSKELFGFFV